MSSTRSPLRASRLRLAAASLLVPAAAVAMAGCSGAPEAPPQSVAFVVGHRSNASVVPWSVLYQHFPVEAGAGSQVVVVAVDGSPGGVPLSDEQLPVTQSSYDADDARTLLAAKTKKAVESASATAPEADVLGAIGTAARSLQGAPGSCTVVVADSMLSTAGALPFQNGYLGADPEDVLASLDGAGSGAALPDLDGCDVVVIGAGVTTAPQPALTEVAQQRLRGVWSGVLTEAGAAAVSWEDVASASRTTAGTPAVTVVDVPAAAAPVVAEACTVVLGQEQVSFRPDSAQFVDPAAAQAVIEDAAAQLAACPGAVTLTGTTSSAGTPEGRQETSRERAEAVRAVLAQSRGVDAASIAVVAAGTDFPQFVEDRDAQQHLVPALAAQNRTVRISVA